MLIPSLQRNSRLSAAQASRPIAPARTRGECWAANQCHIALGFLLLAAAGMGVDATTLGGMHFEKVDEILGLAAKGQKSVMACALGYRSSDDWNADAPKSRFPLDAVATIL